MGPVAGEKAPYGPGPPGYYGPRGVYMGSTSARATATRGRQAHILMRTSLGSSSNCSSSESLVAALVDMRGGPGARIAKQEFGPR